MILTIGTALAGLLTVTQTGEDLVLRHDLSPTYARYDYESACGSAVFRVRFRNGPEQFGRVDHLTIDGIPVPDAAEILQIRAARRAIERIGIMNCGEDARKPVFRGVMSFSEMESRAARLRPSLYFRITRQGREGWRFTLD